PAAALLDETVHGAPQLRQAPERLGLVESHEPAVADHVGRHDRRQFTLHGLFEFPDVARHCAVPLHSCDPTLVLPHGCVATIGFARFRQDVADPPQPSRGHSDAPPRGNTRKVSKVVVAKECIAMSDKTMLTRRHLVKSTGLGLAGVAASTVASTAKES